MTDTEPELDEQGLLRKAWGQRVSEIREDAGISQSELARRCGDGVKQATISRIEQGERFPSERMKQLLAGALRKSVGELFPYSPTPPPHPQQGQAA